MDYVQKSFDSKAKMMVFVSQLENRLSKWSYQDGDYILTYQRETIQVDGECERIKEEPNNAGD